MIENSPEPPGRVCPGPGPGVTDLQFSPRHDTHNIYHRPTFQHPDWDSVELRIPIHQNIHRVNQIVWGPWLGLEILFPSFWMQCENCVKQTKSNYPTGFEVFLLVMFRLGSMLWLLLVVRCCRYWLWYFVVTQFFVSEITKRYWTSSSSIVSGSGLLKGSDRTQPAIASHPNPFPVNTSVPLFTWVGIRASLESFPWWRTWLPSLHPTMTPGHGCIHVKANFVGIWAVTKTVQWERDGRGAANQRPVSRSLDHNQPIRGQYSVPIGASLLW